MLRMLLLPLAALILGAPTGPDSIRRDPAALAVVAMTRDTRADYIVISDTTTDFDGERSQFPSGEFHSGKFHRFEDAKNRVVANCESRGGHRLWVPDDKLSSSPDEADRACGIAPFDEAAPVRLIGRPATRFGEAVRVRVTYGGYVRTYDVLADGAIVRNEWRENEPSGTVIFFSEATEYCPKALPTAAFTRASLRQAHLDDPCGQ